MTSRGEAPVRVLMSEGSSLSARESLTALGRAGYEVEVVDANPLCLARFSKYCRQLHIGPRFGLDPAGYLERVISILRDARFDVLFPAHEQAFLFARFKDRLSKLTLLALPSFDTFLRLQSKVGFAGVLRELALPSPPTVVARDEIALREAARERPIYMKTAFGTAGHGLFCVRSDDDLERTIENVRAHLSEGVVVQGVVQGPLERMQAVFDTGRMVGFHANRQVVEGVSGGDLVMESVPALLAREHMERIGRHLMWHGGLSIDYIVDRRGEPNYIDANPRLAETGNALAVGLNLPELLVRISMGEKLTEFRNDTTGVCSFMGIQALLVAARDTGSRWRVARSLADLVLRRDVFANGTEELTPLRSDALALIPLAAVAGALIIKPSFWKRLASATVDAYAATPLVVQFAKNSG